MAVKRPKVLTGLKYSLIAAKGAALYAIDERRAKRYVQGALAAIPGLGAKLSQVLNDALGQPDAAAGNRSLPSQLTIEQVAALIAAKSPALHQDLDQIDPAGFGASLSQVHRGVLRNGREVAIKIQYPHLKESLTDQLDLIVSTAKITAPAKYQVALTELAGFFLASFHRELDYRQEAAMQQRFAAIAAAISGTGSLAVRVPTVYPELSSSTVLVQSFEPSTAVADAAQQWPKEQRYGLADGLGQFFATALIEHGLVHSDWHSGNFGFRLGHAGPEAVVYDYGSVLTLTDGQRRALHALLASLQLGQAISPYDHLVTLGFDGDKLSHIADRLPALCAKVFGPLLAKGRFYFRDWRLAEGIDQVLGADKWWFRSAGPPWFLQLMRSCYGLFQGIDQLGVGVNLGLDGPLSRVGSPAVMADHSQRLSQRPQPMAKQLVIIVTENGRQKAHITLPALAVDELADLIPASAKQAVTVDIAALCRRVQRSGYKPQEIFHSQQGAKTLSVRLI